MEDVAEYYEKADSRRWIMPGRFWNSIGKTGRSIGRRKRVLRLWNGNSPAAGRPQRPQIGRNDPCWCGSGKKYKKCHLAQDEKEKVRL